MSKSKRFSFSVVEMGVMNPKYKGFRGGRIEVFDRNRGDGYACYEASFLIPKEFMESFRAVWDEKESNKMPKIIWDCPKSKTEYLGPKKPLVNNF